MRRVERSPYVCAAFLEETGNAIESGLGHICRLSTWQKQKNDSAHVVSFSTGPDPFVRVVGDAGLQFGVLQSGRELNGNAWGARSVRPRLQRKRGRSGAMNMTCHTVAATAFNALPRLCGIVQTQVPGRAVQRPFILSGNLRRFGGMR